MTVKEGVLEGVRFADAGIRERLVTWLEGGVGRHALALTGSMCSGKTWLAWRIYRLFGVGRDAFITAECLRRRARWVDDVLCTNYVARFDGTPSTR